MDAISAAACIIITCTAYLRGRLSPATACAFLWATIFTVRTIDPLGIAPLRMPGSLIILVGLAALVTPTLLARKTEVLVPPPAAPRPSLVRVWTLYLATLGIGLYATWMYRTTVERFAGGAYGSLSAEQIRAASNGAARYEFGLWPAMTIFLPMAGCIALLAMIQIHRAWGVAAAFALVLALQSTSRTTLLGALVTMGVFYGYLRSSERRRRDAARNGSKRGRVRTALLLLAGTGACLAVFEAIGSSLGKSERANQLYPNYPWPDWSLSAVLYQIGGPSALQVSLDSHRDPYDGVTSFYMVFRLLNLLGFNFQAGDTIASYAYIPAPFNVYTGFGQLYFDGGYLIVLIGFLILGALMSNFHSSALSGRLGSAYASAVLLSVAMTLPLGYRLFNLDVVMAVVIGAFVLSGLERPRVRYQPSQEASMQTGSSRY